MAAAALGLAGLWVHQDRKAAAAAVLDNRLRHGLAAVALGSSLALRLRARIAAEADYRDGDHERIVALIDEAKRLGDPTAVADIVSLAHHCMLGPDNGESRRRLSQELIAASRYTNRRSDLLMGILWYTVDLVLAAEPFADRHLTELRETLADHQHLAVSYVVAAIEVMLTIRAGHFDQAEMDAKDCLDQGLAAGDIDAFGWHGAHLVAIRWFQGASPNFFPCSRTWSTLRGSARSTTPSRPHWRWRRRGGRPPPGRPRPGTARQQRPLRDPTIEQLAGHDVRCGRGRLPAR
jgi:hypothetical protein